MSPPSNQYSGFPVQINQANFDYQNFQNDFSKNSSGNYYFNYEDKSVHNNNIDYNSFPNMMPNQNWNGEKLIEEYPDKDPQMNTDNFNCLDMPSSDMNSSFA